MDRNRMLALLRERNLAVAPDDPVLEVAAIFEIVADDALKSIEAVVTAQADRITAAGVQQVERAKEIAAEAAGRAGTEVERRLNAGADQVTRRQLEYVDSRIERVESAARSAINAAWISGSAAVLSVIAFAVIARFLW